MQVLGYIEYNVPRILFLEIFPCKLKRIVILNYFPKIKIIFC